jgi:hypothetical protein
MQPCQIIKTDEYTNKKVLWGKFKSKKDAIQYLKTKGKTSQHLYSICVFVQTTHTLICNHAENDNVTYYRIEPIH